MFASANHSRGLAVYGVRLVKNFSKNDEKGLGKYEKVLHNSQSLGALAQLVEQRTLNP